MLEMAQSRTPRSNLQKSATSWVFLRCLQLRSTRHEKGAEWQEVLEKHLKRLRAMDASIEGFVKALGGVGAVGA